jgi:hypothetical protein
LLRKRRNYQVCARNLHIPKRQNGQLGAYEHLSTRGFGGSCGREGRRESPPPVRKGDLQPGPLGGTMADGRPPSLQIKPLAQVCAPGLTAGVCHGRDSGRPRIQGPGEELCLYGSTPASSVLVSQRSCSSGSPRRPGVRCFLDPPVRFAEAAHACGRNTPTGARPHAIPRLAAARSHQFPLPSMKPPNVPPPIIYPPHGCPPVRLVAGEACASSTGRRAAERGCAGRLVRDPATSSARLFRAVSRAAAAAGAVRLFTWISLLRFHLEPGSVGG